MKTLLSPKLFLTAALLTSGLAHAQEIPGLPALQSNSKQAKTLSLLISKTLNSVQGLTKFDGILHLTGQIPQYLSKGLTLNSIDADVNVGVSMGSPVMAELLTDTGKDNLRLGRAGLEVLAHSVIKSDEAKKLVTAVADITFTVDGKSKAFPASFGVMKPNTAINIELESLHIDGKFPFDPRAAVLAVPLAAELKLTCVANLKVIDTKNKTAAPQAIKPCIFHCEIQSRN